MMFWWWLANQMELNDYIKLMYRISAFPSLRLKIDFELEIIAQISNKSLNGYETGYIVAKDLTYCSLLKGMAMQLLANYVINRFGHQTEQWLFVLNIKSITSIVKKR